MRLNLEKLLKWSEPKTLNTKYGLKNLREALEPPDEGFWTLWKENKEEMKEQGISVKKDPDGSWVVNWWQKVEPSQE